MHLCCPFVAYVPHIHPQSPAVCACAFKQLMICSYAIECMCAGNQAAQVAEKEWQHKLQQQEQQWAQKQQLLEKHWAAR